MSIQLFIRVNACMMLGETTVKLHDLYKLSCINKVNMDMFKSPESLTQVTFCFGLASIVIRRAFRFFQKLWVNLEQIWYVASSR